MAHFVLLHEAFTEDKNTARLVNLDLVAWISAGQPADEQTGTLALPVSLTFVCEGEGLRQMSIKESFTDVTRILESIGAKK